MKLEKRDRIIEILKFHGEMIGNDSEEAKQLIREMIQLENITTTDMNTKRVLTRQEEADQIISEICRVAEIGVDELKSKRRNREFVLPRQVACYILAEKFKGDLTFSRLGKMVGVHHATVIYSHRVVSEGIAVSDRLVMNIINRMNEQKQAA